VDGHYDDRLDGSRAFYHALADGLMCLIQARGVVGAVVRIEKDCGADAAVARFGFSGMIGEGGVCVDLRKFLLQILERHIEK